MPVRQKIPTKKLFFAKESGSSAVENLHTYLIFSEWKIMVFFTLILSGQTDNRRQAPKWTLFMEVNDRSICISSSEATQIRVGAPQHAGWWRNERVEAFLCTCVKAKQILESQLFPWVISDDHCYNLRFTAKQKERKKKQRKKTHKTSPGESSCKSCKTTGRKQGEGMEASWK